MIIPIWQQLYQSSHRLAQQIGQERNEPATHTGTLDPLAQGVLVVLTGEDRFLKGKLTDWTKEYSFSILWGIRTDTGDQLGLIEKVKVIQPSQGQISSVCEKFPEVYDQAIPIFSARRWQGKSAFDAAREKVALPKKTRQVELKNLTLIGSEIISFSTIMQKHSSSVHNVQGDFRQNEITQSWQEKLGNLPKDLNLLLTHHQVETSPGTYIRQLVQDMAEHVKIPATTWAITRTRNGPYSQESIFLT